MRILTGALILALSAVAYSHSVEVESLKEIVGAQSENIMVLEQDNQFLRSEIIRVSDERDSAIAELGAAKQAFMISRGAKRIARVVNAEANNQPELGQMLVARVVMNRTQANPGKTVDDIIDKRNAFADSGTYTQGNMLAVLDAALDVQYHGLFTFFNPKTATNQAFVKKKMPDAVLKVGDHVFCQ